MKCHPCKNCKICTPPEIITAYTRAGDFYITAPAQSASGLEGFSIAVDIGTTTLAFELLNLRTGEVIAAHSCLNSQREYGADVLTRISSANEGNLHRLQALILQDLENGIKALTVHADTPPALIITGNTTMLHLLQAHPCDTLGVYPFTPFSTAAKNTKILDHDTYIFPCISAFIGADVVAGLFYLDYPHVSGHNLLIDLGTNAEIALFSREKILVTSAAAGNAFIDSESGKIGTESIKSPSQEILYAKAAIRAAIEILLEEEKISYKNINRVYLAGGFGYKIDIVDAEKIGMFPAPLTDKIKQVGNIALGGAAKYALHPFLPDIRAEEINLAMHDKFNDYFIKYIDM